MTPRSREFWWQVGATIVMVPYLTACALTAAGCAIAKVFGVGCEEKR